MGITIPLFFVTKLSFFALFLLFPSTSTKAGRIFQTIFILGEIRPLQKLLNQLKVFITKHLHDHEV